MEETREIQISSAPSTSSNILPNIRIFTNESLSKSLIHLKKIEFESYYSPKHKYPLMIYEIISKTTGKTAEGEERIDRATTKDPYMLDKDLPTDIQFTIAEYVTLMKYGLSMGHNTPAGNHKTNRAVFDESFLMSNISPQEMMCNCGVWVLIEEWVKSLASNHRLGDEPQIHCFTGSIPDSESVEVDGIVINIPTHWYKVLVYAAEKQDIVYTLGIMVPNDKLFMKRMDMYKMDAYIIPIAKLELAAGISVTNMMKLYGLYDGKQKIQSLRNLISMTFKPPYIVQIQMDKCNWFGRIIYAATLDELEKVWVDIQAKKEKFRDLQYHEEYYNMIKKRFKEEES